MRGNLVTSLRRRRRPCPIEEYDRLPPELRSWLAQAALPWSPHSALRLWRKYLRESAGNTSAARQRLDMIEARMLAKDAPRIWGLAAPPARSSPPAPGAESASGDRPAPA